MNRFIISLIALFALCACDNTAIEPSDKDIVPTPSQTPNAELHAYEYDVDLTSENSIMDWGLYTDGDDMSCSVYDIYFTTRSISDNKFFEGLRFLVVFPFDFCRDIYYLLKPGYYPLTIQNPQKKEFDYYTIFHEEDNISSMVVIFADMYDESKTMYGMPIVNAEMHVKHFEKGNYDIEFRMIDADSAKYYYQFKTKDRKSVV